MPRSPEPVVADLVVRDAAELVTCKGAAPLSGAAMDDLHRIPGGWLAAHRGRIVFVGDALDFRTRVRPLPDCTTIDASGRTVLPGFVDPHTHVVYGGDRLDEFDRRLRGETYEKIAAEGGGIQTTVARTRAASDDELFRSALRRLDRMLLHGTTTAEVKSGYGLDPEAELRLLRVIHELKEAHPVEISPTVLAHAVPPERADRRTEYVEEFAADLLPRVRKEGLAESCDVFCDEGAFTPAETRRILEAAAALGFGLRVHADELAPVGAAQLAADLGAASADHLVHVTSAAIERLRTSGTAAVLLPGTTFFLMKPKYAPGLRLIDEGVAVALGSDCNPGSCPTMSIPAVCAVAALQLRLSVAQVLHAVTLNAAWALRRHRRIGSLEVGKQADLVVLDAPEHRFLVYHWGVNLVDTVVKAGRVVVRGGRLRAPARSGGREDLFGAREEE